MTTLDPTLLPALSKVLESLEQPPARRRIYANDPLADVNAVEDYHLRCWREQLKRDRQLRDAMAERDEDQQRAMGGQDFDTWSELNMAPSDDRR